MIRPVFGARCCLRVLPALPSRPLASVRVEVPWRLKQCRRLIKTVAAASCPVLSSPPDRFSSWTKEDLVKKITELEE